MKNIIFISLALLLLVSCDDSPVFDLEPKIEFLEVLPDRVEQGAFDAVTIVIHFQDGDGDLGIIDGTENVPNLFLIIEYI